MSASKSVRWRALKKIFCWSFFCQPVKYVIHVAYTRLLEPDQISHTQIGQTFIPDVKKSFKTQRGRIPVDPETFCLALCIHILCIFYLFSVHPTNCYFLRTP